MTPASYWHSSPISSSKVQHEWTSRRLQKLPILADAASRTWHLPAEFSPAKRPRNRRRWPLGRLSSIVARNPRGRLVRRISAQDMTCEHLQQLETEILTAGLQETFRGQAWSDNCRERVVIDCHFDREPIRKRLAASFLFHPIQELGRQLPAADRAFWIDSQKLSGGIFQSRH